MQYFVSHGDGAVHGPYSREQLFAFAKEGRITHQTNVRSTTDSGWFLAGSLIDFREVAPPPPPPPPPTPIAPRPTATSATQDSAIRMLLPVEVDPVAFIAGYLGLLAIALLPAPLALGVGLWALARVRGRKDVRGAGRAWTAVLLGLLGTLGLMALAIARL